MADFASPTNAVITIASDDDLSAAVDVPPGSTTCLVEVPALTSAAVTLQVSFDGTTFLDLYSIENTQQGRTTASTGSFMQPFVFFGWVKQLKVKTGAGQAANRTFKVSFIR